MEPVTVPPLSRPREPSIEESFFLQHRGLTRCRLEGSYPSEEPVTIRRLCRLRPPHSASSSQRRPSIARGSVARTQAPVHPDTRTCLELLWALAVTEPLAALLRDFGLALRLLQQIVNATHGHCSRGPDPRATKGIAPRALPHPGALSRRCSSPLRRPNNAECCSEPRSSLRRSTLRPNPLRRTRRPATPRARGQRHERDVGRGTSRPLDEAR